MTPHLLTPTSQIRLKLNPDPNYIHQFMINCIQGLMRLHPTWHHSQTNHMHILWIKKALGKICDHLRIVLVVRLLRIFNSGSNKLLLINLTLDIIFISHKRHSFHTSSSQTSGLPMTTCTGTTKSILTSPSRTTLTVYAREIIHE